MAKFSILTRRRRAAPSPVADRINYAGGEAFSESPKLELVALLLTTFLQDEFYRTEQQTMLRLRELIARVTDPRFVAKAALYARRVHGMRSVSHLVAGELAHSVKGVSWSRSFYADVAQRADDVLEILGYYLAVYGQPLPNSLKKGLGAALARFDAYQLAKYRRSHAEFKLVDAVNLVHPPATPALTQLVRGELGPAKTWETALTQAGEAETGEAVAKTKADAWASLVRERKLGYLALLRNVRNILTHAPEVVDELVSQLTDAEAVRRARIFPFQFLSAVDVLRQGNLPGADRVLVALDTAVDHALANVPRFEGSTLVALDCSGSMAGRPQVLGSLFSTVLVRSSGADLLLFSNDAQYHTIHPRDPVLTAASRIPFAAAGTNFHAIFERAGRAYDRIIILSDMQGWIGHAAPTEALRAYERRHGVVPRIFSFDLKGYGTLQFPQPRVFALAGWSDRVFDILQKLDADPQALIAEVEAMHLPG